MGTYVYHLTRKSRKIVVDGSTEEAFLLAYAYKPGVHVSRVQRTAEARGSRLIDVWHRRKPPAYVVLGEFRDGATVMVGYDMQQVVWWDTDKLPGAFVGKLRVHGRRLVLERWHHQDLPADPSTPEFLERFKAQASGEWDCIIVGPNSYRIRTPNRLNFSLIR